MKIARRHQLIIYSDEIYDRLVMDGLEHIPIATLAPDLFVVTLNGLSKSYIVKGFRVGWMVLSGDKSNVKGYIEGLNMLSSMRLCSNVLSQQIIQTALRGYQSVDELLLPRWTDLRTKRIHFIMQSMISLDYQRLSRKQLLYLSKIDTKRFQYYQ